MGTITSFSQYLTVSLLTFLVVPVQNLCNFYKFAKKVDNKLKYEQK